MDKTISRMLFHRDDLSGKKAPLRPSWALSERDFERLCGHCDDYIKH